MTESIVLRVRSLRKTYHVGLSGCAASARALDDVHFEVARGEVVAVVGPANCGKTTLLRCAAGLLAADTGSLDRMPAADGRVAVTRYLHDPIELSQLRDAEESWDLALVDNCDVVRGDVGGAFALLAAARAARTTGRSMLLAAREIRAVANVATRIVILEQGRIVAPAGASAARVAETAIRL